MGNERHKKSEKECAEWFGKLQPMSGALETSKGDVLGLGIYDQFILENKFTEKASRSIKIAELKKVKKEARTHVRDWLFRLDFNFVEKVIVMSEQTFRNTMEALDELREESRRYVTIKEELAAANKLLNEKTRIINELKVLLENAESKATRISK